MINDLDRRETLKLAGFTFASAVSVGLFTMPADAREWVADQDGMIYPVSPKHAAEIDAGFGSSWPRLETSENTRLTLAALSNERHLTDQELLTIKAADHIRNMNSAIKHLKGRNFREMFEYIDQVHGNKLNMHCGCELVHLFDHHLRTDPDKIVLYPHYPIYVCKDHQYLSNDWEQHFVTVVNEYRAKQPLEITV